MEIHKIYGRLAYMKKTCPDKFKKFTESKGKCEKCGTTVEVSVYKEDKKLNVLCRSCNFILRDCKRLGMVESVYMNEREVIVAEIIGQIRGDKNTIKHINEKDITRDMQIYRLHLFGRSHADIARKFGISRERVRQLVYKLKM